MRTEGTVFDCLIDGDVFVSVR